MDCFLSIIVPVYNVEKYLDECLESIVTQISAEAVEIILIDDGSKDKSGEICECWKEKYSFIRVIHQKNGGLSKARNVGIQNSTGQYIMLVDSDDWIRKDALEIILNLLTEKRPDVLIYNRELVPACKLNGDFSREMFSKGIDDFLGRVLREFPFGAGPVRYLLNKKFLEKNSLWFFEGIYHEDMLWSPKVLCVVENIEICEEKLYLVRNQMEEGRDSICRSKKNWEKRIRDMGIISHQLNMEAEKYHEENIRKIFLLRMSAVTLQNRLLLAQQAGTLPEIVAKLKKEKSQHPEIAFFSKRFGIFVRLFGLEAGTKLFGRVWKEQV